MTLITVTNGQGRPKNPYDRYTEVLYDFGPVKEHNYDWDKFEQSVQYHDAPGIDNGEWEAILADAVLKDNGKIEIYDVKPLYGIRELGWKEIKVWILAKPFPETIEKVEAYENRYGDPDVNFPVEEQWSQLKARMDREVSKEEGKTAEDDHQFEKEAEAYYQSHWASDNKSVSPDPVIEAYCAGAFRQLSSQKAEVERLREALQNIADSTDGNNPHDAVFYFTAINALNPKSK